MPVPEKGRRSFETRLVGPSGRVTAQVIQPDYRRAVSQVYDHGPAALSGSPSLGAKSFQVEVRTRGATSIAFRVNADRAAGDDRQQE